MTKKSNEAIKSFAEEGLEGVQEIAVEAEALVAVDSGNDEEELVQVGGLEPLAYFFRFNAPKKPTKHAFKILESGTVITGIYERSFTVGKFKNPTYVIRLNTGELVGLPSTGRLKKSMDKLAEGSKVKITYSGMSPIKGGEYEGTDAHNFTVFGNKLK